MNAKIEFFPVGNGDMTLLTLESGRTILMDINIRKRADNEYDEAIDVASLLRSRLQRDINNRLYVDAFLLTHPDEDHCKGLTRHFHLGKPEDWKNSDDKILIREMWSSPIIFRRKQDVEGSLCEDAEAWWTEARRRVYHYKTNTNKASITDGNYIQILGEDRDGKTDALSDILVKTNSEITRICGKTDNTFRARLLAPQLMSKADAETLAGKNHSSTIVRFNIKAGSNTDAGLFLAGGDAEVENWERVWNRNQHQKDRLSYNILLAPHHCSWHSLSFDSWSEKKGAAKVADLAYSALSQAKDKAFIIASSNEIKDDEKDPPCIRAKQEYKKITAGVNGSFLCTAEDCTNDVLLIEIDSTGPTWGKMNSSKDATSLLGIGGTCTPQEVKKRGGGLYA